MEICYDDVLDSDYRGDGDNDGKDLFLGQIESPKYPSLHTDDSRSPPNFTPAGTPEGTRASFTTFLPPYRPGRPDLSSTSYWNIKSTDKGQRNETRDDLHVNVVDPRLLPQTPLSSESRDQGEKLETPCAILLRPPVSLASLGGVLSSRALTPDSSAPLDRLFDPSIHAELRITIEPSNSSSFAW